MATIESSPLGIYVSIPFCRSKCTYCNFASGVFASGRMDAYVDRLVEEIRETPGRVQNWSACLARSADTVYFGGGTPSLLSLEQMQQILDAIREVFTLLRRPEITLECAPGQLSEGLLRGLQDLGVNRVSLGVQSFVDKEAAAVGRLHTRAITLAEIARLRRAGIEDINVDLIAGLPHQTPESWQVSLTEAVGTGVPHVSVYMLDVDEDSRLGREMLAGGARYGVGQVPDEQAIAAMYDGARAEFAAAGIAPYEISNFARAGRESRHNLKYWTRQPYIGFGLDAHSFLPGRDGGAIRVGTTEDLTAYLDRTALETATPVSEVEAIEEAWFLGLRLSRGVGLAAMESRIGRAAMEMFEPVLAECEREELLEQDLGRVCLTRRGRLFANEVFSRFIGVLIREGQMDRQGVLA